MVACEIDLVIIYCWFTNVVYFCSAISLQPRLLNYKWWDQVFLHRWDTQ